MFFFFLNVAGRDNYAISITFLISLVSMHLSILRTVDMSMCSLEMELSHVVKLSTVARNSTQVNFKMLNILLMMLSRRKQDDTLQVNAMLVMVRLSCSTVMFYPSHTGLRRDPGER